jgi:putative addiction module component (TIGR02574 family)
MLHRGPDALLHVRATDASYADAMTGSARKLLQDVLALPEDERLELASEIIASVDGPRDADWESAWLDELDRRADAAKARGGTASEWTEVRARILQRLGRG